MYSIVCSFFGTGLINWFSVTLNTFWASSFVKKNQTSPSNWHLPFDQTCADDSESIELFLILQHWYFCTLLFMWQFRKINMLGSINWNASVGWATFFVLGQLIQNFAVSRTFSEVNCLHIKSLHKNSSYIRRIFNFQMPTNGRKRSRANL